MILCVLIFNLFPILVITFTDYEPQRQVLPSEVFERIKWHYFWGFLLYLLTFLTMLFAIKVHAHRGIKRFRVLPVRVDDMRKVYIKNKLLVTLLILFCAFSIAAHALNGGLSKIALLGSDMNGREFRFMGFDDIPRIYLILLAITRRFVLPFLILYLGIIRSVNVTNSRLLYWFLVSLQLFACTLTFARAPFLTLILVMAIPSMLIGGKLKRLFVFSVLLLSVISVAGIVTNLQYNRVNFGAPEILGMGWNFFHNRMLFVPNVVPIHDAFSLEFLRSDPLYLKYSRLRALFWGSAIGTSSNLSIFVSPVGYIGDIYRNFNYFGLVLFGAFNAIFIHWLDMKFEKCGPLQNIFIFFGLVALVFYWIMGVVFSMGAIFALMIVYLLANKYKLTRHLNA